MAPLDSADSFDRSYLGPNWYAGRNTAAGIVNGQDLGALVLGPVSINWIGSVFDADQFSEAVIAAGIDANMLVQVHVRMQSSTRARYGFHYNPEKSPAVWEIKYDGVPTAETRIVGNAEGVPPVQGDVIRLEARGLSLEGFVNGQLIISAVDSAPNAILATGRNGITARLKKGTATTYPTPIAASWKGGSLP